MLCINSILLHFDKKQKNKDVFTSVGVLTFRGINLHLKRFAFIMIHRLKKVVRIVQTEQCF